MSGGHIDISFNIEDDFLIISVADNGEGLNDTEFLNLQRILSEPEEVLESTGIINIHFRLQLKFGTCSKLTVHRSGEGGLLVQLFLPIRGACEDVSNVDC